MRLNVATGTRRGRLDFLDASDDEIRDLVRSLMHELSILSGFLALPTDRKTAIETKIAWFRAFLGESRFKQ
jgi:hypothetical protein